MSHLSTYRDQNQKAVFGKRHPPVSVVREKFVISHLLGYVVIMSCILMVALYADVLFDLNMFSTIFASVFNMFDSGGYTIPEIIEKSNNGVEVYRMTPDGWVRAF